MGRILEVGADRTLTVPSEAAAIAKAGDFIRIDPGVYADCAVWRASRLVIEATGPGVVLTGKTCLEQGIFVVAGSDVTVRGITFAGARVPGHNGAGIRASGRNLTVEHSRFLDNENGMLFGGPADSVVRITDSEFAGNGACIGACAHGVYAGAAIYLLDIERCIFRNTRTAHHVKSRALNTMVVDSRIEDGPDGTSSYLIETPDGGNLLVQGNVLEKGPLSSNPRVAISIGVEGVKNPTDRLVIRNNIFRSDLTRRTVFVRNSSAAAVVLEDNTLTGDVEVLETVPE
nr:right-handed parallel beta-helix repeat-containing protein [uncultured Rhodopila sp.]